METSENLENLEAKAQLLDEEFQAGKLNHYVLSSGGSRGGSRGAKEPSFHLEACMQNWDTKQLTRAPAVTSAYHCL